MLMSMTGFGKASASVGNLKISAEIKSLNSKQMDLNVRLPYSFRQQELEVRGVISRRLERGKADMVVTVENVQGAPAASASTINGAVIGQYIEQLRAVSAELGEPLPSDLISLSLRLPEAVTSPTPAEADAEQLSVLSAVVSEAVEQLMQHRRAEGIELEKFFTVRLDAIAALMEEVTPFESERLERIRQRLQEGIAKIPAIDFDKGRLEQEMIFYIEKLDVAEEKQRLAKHIAYFRDTMASPAPGQGKKLGFIAQEMGREINTLGSKSNHASMQACVVRMKDNLEQIKEQVLNVM